MKQFNNIEIHKDNASLMRLLERMKKLENSDFYYDKEASERTNQGCKHDTICGGTHYAVFSSNQEALCYAIVFVSVKGDELKVFNINSSDPRFSNLGITRYNFIINNFFHHFMAKCLDESFTDCISISGEVRSLEDEIGEEAFKALCAWENMCNKEAPIAHPMDENAWFVFLCKLKKNRKKLHPSDFSQWLTEDCKWPSYYNNVIAELEENLEYSQSLLDYYVKFGDI